jgi:hypothetical protein
VFRGAANASLASLSRVLADPKPVSDPAQAEELAYILSVVRARDARRRGAGAARAAGRAWHLGAQTEPAQPSASSRCARRRPILAPPARGRAWLRAATPPATPR